MKLVIPVAQFLGHARQILQFAGRRREIDPGLGMILVEITDKGVLRLSAHDAAAGARIIQRLDGEFDPGSLAMGVDQMDKLVNVLPPRGQLVLEIGDGATRLKAAVGRLKLVVPIFTALDFPPLPRPPAQGFKVTERDFSRIITHVLWAMGQDKSRPNLAGVHMTDELSEATDAHVMAQMRPGIVPEGVDVVVPGDSLSKLRTLVEDSKRELTMSVEPNRVWLRSQTWAVYTTLIAATYPLTREMVFDNDHNHYGTPIHWLTVDRSEVLRAVRRIVSASVGQEERRIGASVTFAVRDDGDLHLESHYPFDDTSMSIFVDECVDWDGGSVSVDNLEGFLSLREIGIYGHFMSSALNALVSDTVKVMWADGPDLGGVPMQFHDEDAGIVALIMPRRL